jgi:hypothetical protein
LLSELGNESGGGIVGKDGIGARIGWRLRGIRRGCIVDSRVYGESEEPMGAIATKAALALSLRLISAIDS